jgi:predicted HTH domain antitoxin
VKFWQGSCFSSDFRTFVASAVDGWCLRFGSENRVFLKTKKPGFLKKPGFWAVLIVRCYYYSNMSLLISKETLEKIEMSEGQLRIEIAVMLFQQERFTLAQAARFAQINQLAFQRLLASRRIPLHYGMEELMEDFYSLKDSVRLGLEAI